MLKNASLWIDRARDIIHADHPVEYNVLTPTDHDAKLSISAQSTFLHMPTVDDETILPAKNASRLVIYEDHFVIHASYEQAVDSGLFGAWAEERFILVDTRDDARLDRLSRLPYKLGTRCMYYKGLPEKCHEEITVADCASHSRRAMVREEFEFNWLETHDKYPTSVTGTSPGNFQQRPSEFFPVGYPGDNPWVIKTLETMPEIEIALGFHLHLRRPT